MLTIPIGAKVGRQAITTLVPKMVINANLRAPSNLPRSIPPTSARRTTLINPTTVTCFNYRKNSHFTLSCLELKDIGNIKEIEEEEEKEEISNKLKKEEP